MFTNKKDWNTLLGCIRQGAFKEIEPTGYVGREREWVEGGEERGKKRYNDLF